MLGSQPDYPDSIDTSDDYLLWINTITGQYLVKTEEKVPPDTDGVTISHVLWNQIRKDKLAPDSPLMKFDRTFRFGKKALGVIVPKLDDIWIDDFGVRWRVMLVEVLSFGNEYRVHTVKSTFQNTAVG